MNYARLPSGEWIDLDGDDCPPWYDSDAAHDRAMNAERDPREIPPLPGWRRAPASQTPPRRRCGHAADSFLPDDGTCEDCADAAHYIGGSFYEELRRTT